MAEQALVTGGSGFVGGHVIVALLRAGYHVKTTVRNLAKAEDVRAMVRNGGEMPDEKLRFCVAALDRDDGWEEAVADCTYVHHVASPFPTGRSVHEDTLIIPARDGALRILRAARDAGVKRVVMTSSFAAIGYGHPERATPFDEDDWTDLNGPAVDSYAKSKTIAERAAWDFIAREGDGLELAVINPSGIFGPILGPSLSASIQAIQVMLNGGMPGAPRIYFGVVDVRDVAQLHLRAMIDPRARGQRLLAVAGPAVSLLDVSGILRVRLGPAARRAPTQVLPDWLMRLFAIFRSDARGAMPQLGLVRQATNAKACKLLDWSPISTEDALAATGESLIGFGLVKP